MAATRFVSDWLGYVPFRVAAALFGVLPESVVRRIGIWGGTLASKRFDAKRPLLARHMKRVLGPGATDVEVQLAVDGMYRSYGRYWAETFWFRPRHRDAIIESVDRIHFEPVHEAKAAGRGIVFAVSHVGNWEIAGLIADDLGLNLMAVAEDLPNPLITDWFLDVRRQFGIDVVLTSDPSRRSKMIRRLKEGGALALLADRDVTGNGVAVEFFGEVTTVPAGPVALAELTNSVVLPVVAFFKDGGGYRIEVGDPVEVSTDGTRSERVKLGSQRVANALEVQIGKQPSQWHLFQPNWPSDFEDVTGEPS
jgi:lauroyl/myristoyl acyltransferase